MRGTNTLSLTIGPDGTLAVIRKPVRPLGYGQVLVRMKACGICKYDLKNWKGTENNSVYRESPGHESVGIIENVGEGVEDLLPGDKVATIQFGSGFSEYFIADAENVVKIPDEVERFELWISEPAACVVSALRLARIEPGNRVAVIGCGYMGCLLIQGLPGEYIPYLTALDVDERRLRLAEKYGADVLLSEPGPGGAEAMKEAAGGEADVVFECSGAPGTIATATAMTKPGGRLCLFGHHTDDQLVPTGAWHMRGVEVLNTSPFLSKNFRQDHADAVQLMKRGKLHQEALITHTYGFGDVVHAFREVDSSPPGLIKAVVVG
jgi:threonine dehydrogenase-like Zn-dependent dehydrogenase